MSLRVRRKWHPSLFPTVALWFREIVRSENSLIREDGQSRNFITGIYYLLERDAKSAWHRVKNADEIWIYLRGDPLNLWCLDDDNELIRNLTAVTVRYYF